MRKAIWRLTLTGSLAMAGAIGIPRAAMADQPRAVTQPATSQVGQVFVIVRWRTSAIKIYDENGNFIAAVTAQALPALPILIADADIDSPHGRIRLLLQHGDIVETRFIDQNMAVLSQPVPPLRMPAARGPEDPNCATTRCATQGTVTENTLPASLPHTPRVAAPPTVAALSTQQQSNASALAAAGVVPVVRSIRDCASGVDRNGTVLLAGFPSGDPRLNDQQKYVLQANTERWRTAAEAGSEFVIVSYDNSAARSAALEKVAQQRAQEVKDIIRAAGVPPDQLHAESVSLDATNLQAAGPSDPCPRHIEIVTYTPTASAAAPTTVKVRAPSGTAARSAAEPAGARATAKPTGEPAARSTTGGR